MAKKKKIQEKPKEGRPTKFIPETRQALIQRLTFGNSMADACAVAGVGRSTVLEWMAIGEAVEEKKKHRRMPADPLLQAEFAEFATEIKKAQTSQRQIAIATVTRAGRDTWTHRKTGVIRNTPPPPITWLNIHTGALIFNNPQMPGVLPPEVSLHPDDWEMEWSGQTWSYNAGSWQPMAWILERTDPENWGQKSKIEVNFDLKSAAKLQKLFAQKGVDFDTVLVSMVARLEAGQDDSDSI